MCGNFNICQSFYTTQVIPDNHTQSYLTNSVMAIHQCHVRTTQNEGFSLVVQHLAMFNKLNPTQTQRRGLIFFLKLQYFSKSNQRYLALCLTSLVSWLAIS